MHIRSEIWYLFGLKRQIIECKRQIIQDCSQKKSSKRYIIISLRQIVQRNRQIIRQ